MCGRAARSLASRLRAQLQVRSQHQRSSKISVSHAKRAETCTRVLQQRSSFAGGQQQLRGMATAAEPVAQPVRVHALASCFDMCQPDRASQGLPRIALGLGFAAALGYGGYTLSLARMLVRGCSSCFCRASMRAWLCLQPPQST